MIYFIAMKNINIVFIDIFYLMRYFHPNFLLFLKHGFLSFLEHICNKCFNVFD